MGGSEYSPSPKPKEPEKNEQTAFELRELGPSFLGERELMRKAWAKLLKIRRGERRIWKGNFRETKEKHPQHFYKEGLYFRKDKGTVMVIARWKKGEEWCLVPLRWKVEIKGGEFSLEKFPYIFFDFGEKLSPENLEKVESLAKDFITEILKQNKNLVGGEAKRTEIILDPQADLPKEEGGEENFSPQEGQLESSPINPFADDEDVIFGKVRIIVDEGNPRIEIVLPLKEGDVIFVSKWTGRIDHRGLGVVENLSIKEGEGILKKLPLEMVKKLEELAKFAAQRRFAD